MLARKIRLVGEMLAKRPKGWRSLLWNSTMAQLRRPGPLMAPVHVSIEPTNACNARCPVCPVGEHTLTRPAESLDPQLFETFMQQVSPYLLTLALWAWGEPLLHPQLAEILRIASSPLVTDEDPRKSWLKRFASVINVKLNN